MATWATVATPNTGAEFLIDMACIGVGKFVAVGTNGTVLTSGDGGQTWVARTAAAANDWQGVASDGTRVVAVSNNGANRVMVSTDDGHTWTSHAAAEANSWASVTYAAFLGKFIAVAPDGVHRVMTSIDGGTTWVAQTAASAQVWCGVVASSSLLMAAAPSRAMTSPDGVTWTDATNPLLQMTITGGSNVVVFLSSTGDFAMGGYNPGTFLSRIVTSPDGVAWTTHEAAPLDGYLTLQGTVAAAALGGYIAALPLDAAFAPTPTIIGNSQNGGTTWTAEDTTESGAWQAGAWDDASGVVVFWDGAQTNTMLLGTFPIAPPPPPVATTATPASGPVAGGTVVTITGSGFNMATSVTFDGLPAAFTVLSDTTLTAVSPAHAAGDVTIAIVGTGRTVAFTYAMTRVLLPPVPRLH